MPPLPRPPVDRRKTKESDKSVESDSSWDALESPHVQSDYETSSEVEVEVEVIEEGEVRMEIDGEVVHIEEVNESVVDAGAEMGETIRLVWPTEEVELTSQVERPTIDFSSDVPMAIVFHPDNFLQSPTRIRCDTPESIGRNDSQPRTPDTELTRTPLPRRHPLPPEACDIRLDIENMIIPTECSDDSSILTPRPPVKRALIIGISYRDMFWPLDPAASPQDNAPPMELPGQHADVRKMESLIIQRGYDLRVMTDEDATPDDLKPTRENIIRSMKELVVGARSGDMFFFYFSGHGGQRMDTSGEEEDGFDETILPIDWEAELPDGENSEILDDEMWDIMLRPLPEGCKFAAVFDSCHSGSALDLPYSLTESVIQTMASVTSSRENSTVIEAIIETQTTKIRGLGRRTRRGPKRRGTGTLDLQIMYELNPGVEASESATETLEECNETDNLATPCSDSDSTTTTRKDSSVLMKHLGHPSRNITALAVCWSACSDENIAWGDENGGAMANAFIDAVQSFGDKVPTYGQVLRRISRGLRQFYERTPGVGQTAPQIPQLSSSQELNVKCDKFHF